jgi:hypothetical protein
MRFNFTHHCMFFERAERHHTNPASGHCAAAGLNAHNPASRNSHVSSDGYRSISGHGDFAAHAAAGPNPYSGAS